MEIIGCKRKLRDYKPRAKVVSEMFSAGVGVKNLQIRSGMVGAMTGVFRLQTAGVYMAKDLMGGNDKSIPVARRYQEGLSAIQSKWNVDIFLSRYKGAIGVEAHVGGGETPNLSFLVKGNQRLLCRPFFMAMEEQAAKVIYDMAAKKCKPIEYTSQDINLYYLCTRMKGSMSAGTLQIALYCWSRNKNQGLTELAPVKLTV